MGCGRLLTTILVLLSALCTADQSFSLNRDLIRSSILDYRAKRSLRIENVHDLTSRSRVRRQSAFPTDDEDFGNDVFGSGDDDGFKDFTGDESLPPDVRTEITPLVPDVEVTLVSEWVWYRCKVNFLHSIVYTESLADYRSDEFHSYSESIMYAVEEYLQRTLDGYSEATPLMFTRRDSDYVDVLIDVGSCSVNSAEDVENAMRSLLRTGSIGEYAVTEKGFSLRGVGADPTREECKRSVQPTPPAPTTRTTERTPPDFDITTSAATTSRETEVEVRPSRRPYRCAENEATCTNGECIDRGYICNGRRDCSDGSDEPVTCGNADSTKCDPTEFLCAGTGVCAQKLWRCDGDDDCGNGFDELDCPTAAPGANCRGIEFECRADSFCVPASYQCDGEADCSDGSDEAGCSKPVVIRPPRKMVTVEEGANVELFCEAVGTPTPIISWRLNWGNVGEPPRVTMTSSGGVGTLSIKEVRRSDQGAYTCEAINSEGSIFAVPDAVLIVEEGEKEQPPCPPGQYGMSPEDCRPCYCFGHASSCQPSKREYDEIGITFTSDDDLGFVQVKPAEVEGANPTPASEPINRNQILVRPAARELQLIDLSKRFLAAAHYWSLPAQFLGAKINSYGGTLTFSFSYNNSYNFEPRPTNHSDVIIEGANGQTLVYHDKGEHPGPTVKHTQRVGLTETDWQTPEGDTASREDMLNILNNVDKILLRTVYDNSMLSTGIGDIRMTVANPSSADGRGSTGIMATMVEECVCHEGYEGLSCQYCADGYERITAGPFAGTCEKIIDESVPPGRTDDCREGYTGKDCSQCAQGYTRVDDVCVLRQVHSCHPAGTDGIAQDGTCVCKRGSEGARCDRCRPGYFVLSSDSDLGCIPCFCMGITNRCSSTRRNRFDVTLSRNVGERILLTNAAATRTFQDSTEVGNQRGRYTARAHLSAMPRDVYYWVLPREFTGDKVTAYGGKLRYTIEYSQQDGAAPISYISDVRIFGNDVTLEWRSGITPLPRRPSSYEVTLVENQWNLPDGSPASREQLMMALADVENFIVRATYANYMLDTTISDISLETALDQDTGMERAIEVEECACPPGYTGLSCEDCEPGYRRVESGSYLGTCVRCFCNGHSDVCDEQTGQCQGCRHNTAGERCDRCLPGFYGDATVGSPTDCRPCNCPILPARGDRPVVATCILDIDGLRTCSQCPPGYEGRNCDRCESGTIEVPGEGCRTIGSTCHCDPYGSIDGTCDADGQCNCKESVQGLKCDTCKPSYFYFSIENVGGGCLPCFCMGVTKECRSSEYIRDKIDADFTASRYGGFSLTTRVRSQRLTSDLEVRSRGEVLSRRRMNLLPSDTYYWRLPDEFLGNKIVSYGGDLRYSVSYTPFSTGAGTRDQDVIIFGNDITLFANVEPSSGVEPRTMTERVVTFKEQHWRRPDGQPATREHLLMALADLEDVLILATYSTSSSESSISRVSMETASGNEFDGGDIAYDVEHCTCPDGYEGLSCEDCSPGYTRSGGGYYLGLCQPCRCNGHADVCDSETGECVDCRDNTVGPNCASCAPGFYSMSADPIDMYCEPCACPLTDNSFSATCEYVRESRNLRCTACEEGYVGTRCENCAEGYEGNPRIPGGKCSRRGSGGVIQAPPTVRVTPATLNVAEGKSATLRCDVISTSAVRVMWRRTGSAAGRPIPARAIINDRDHSLTIRGFTRDDAGTYECVAQNQGGMGSDSGVLTVARKRPMMEVRVEEPTTRRLRTGSQVTFVCTAQSEMNAYIIYWSKRGGRLPRTRATDFNGILHIEDLTEEDSGTYVCTGSNMYDIDQKTATLVVVRDSDAVRPSVTIEPARQSIREGEDVMFRCSADGTPPIRIEWRPSAGETMPPTAKVVDGELYIPSVAMDHSAVFYCRATNAQGIAEATALLDVTAIGYPPVVTVTTPTSIDVREGQNVEMRCSATGLPSPLFSWSRLGKPGLPGNAEPMGGTLQLIKVETFNQDTYICTARNTFGTDEGHIEVNVTSKAIQAPVCKTDPESLTAYVGADASISCVAEGDPPPVVTWVRSDGLRLLPNTKVEGNKLSITNVTMANAGRYLCIATNAGGTTRSEMTLTVENKALPEVQILPRNQQVVEIGGSASFTCKPIAGLPVEVTWSRTDRKPFTSRTMLKDGGIISFTNVTHEDSGSYLCIATNVVGYREVATLLTVTSKPRLTIEPSTDVYMRTGTSVTLRCRADGIPAPNVVWKKVSMFGQHIMMTRYKRYSNELIVHASNVGESAQYICVAVNIAGDAQQKVTVTVGEREAIVKPEVTVEKSVLSTVVGGRVVLRCAATGQPQPDVIWSRKFGQLSTGTSQDDGVLTIPRVTQRDAGQYICKAGNAGGYDEGETTLRIIETPRLRTTPAGPILYIAPGQSASVTCSATDGTRPITYQFKKVSGVMSSNILTLGEILQVLSFDPVADSGRYECVGENEAGRSSVEIKLLLLSAPTVNIQNTDLSVSAGTAVKLECSSDDAGVELVWSRLDGGDIDDSRSSQGNGILRIEDVRESDEGEYVCTATNDAGSSYARAVMKVHALPKAHLKLSSDNDVIRIGSRLELTCTAEGNPTPSVTLTKDGEEVLAAEDGRLVLEKVGLQDSGRYSCVAVNEAGRDVDEATIEVRDSLALSIIPFSPELEITAGEVLALSCAVTGIDDPLQVTWSRNGGALPPSAVLEGNVVQMDQAGVNDGGSYTCTAKTEGKILEKSIEVIINAYIPHFTQSPSSYITLVSNPDFYRSLRITVSFRPNFESGLILYSYGSGGDYISLALVEGKVEFRYNVGSGDAVILSNSKVQLSEWHTVTIARNGREGELILDDEDAVYGTSEGGFQALDLDHPLYVGGYPTAGESLPDSLDFLGQDVGFYGCISQLIIGDDNIDMAASSMVEARVGVLRCKTCGSTGEDSPCQHNSSCLETHSTSTGYACTCLKDYVGPECQFRKEDICGDLDACGPYGSCMPDYERELGYRCECHSGYTGPKCQHKVEEPIATEALLDTFEGPAVTTPDIVDAEFGPVILPTEPVPDDATPSENDFDWTGLDISESAEVEAVSFSKDSFMELDVPHHNPRQFDVVIKIKPRSLEDGLILYNGGVPGGKKRDLEGADIFVSLAIFNKSLEFRYNCGSGDARLVSSQPLSLGEWHTIHANRANRKGILEVDGVVVAEGQSPRRGRRAELNGPLFVGGVKFWDRVPSHVDVRDGFDGCIEKVIIDGTHASLQAALSQKNVELCEVPYTTAAATTAAPTTPEHVDDFEDENDFILFLHSGEPAAKDTLLGTAARFSGDSFIAFPEDTFDHSLAAEQISLSFKSTDPDGLLLIHGQAYGGSFIMLGLKDARLQYSFRLGTGEGKATGFFPVADGKWHKVTVLRRGTFVLMWTDDLPRPVAVHGTGENADGSGLGSVYIGGADDVAFSSGERFRRGFRGCIRDVRFTALGQSEVDTIGADYFDDSKTDPLRFDDNQGSMYATNLSTCKRERSDSPELP